MTIQVITQDLVAYENAAFDKSWIMYQSDGTTPLWSGAATGSAAGSILDAPAGTELLSLTVANSRLVLGDDGLITVAIAAADYAGLFVSGGTTKHWHYFINYIPAGADPRPFRAGTYSLVPR